MIDKTDEYDMVWISPAYTSRILFYYFYRTIRKLLSLAAARLIPWISLKCVAVSSLKRNIVEQNLHIHRQPPVSTFVSAVGSLSLLVSGVSGQGPDGGVTRGAEQVPVVPEHMLHRHPLPGEDSAAEQTLLGVTHVLQKTLLHLNPGYHRLAVLANGFSSGA